MGPTIENCQIEKTTFGIEDHGILTFFVHLRAEHWCQGLGGYACDLHCDTKDYRPGYGLALAAMRKIMETVGVNKWEDLPGTLCRVKKHGLHDQPVIGHIIEDKWFDLRSFMYHDNS